MDAKICDKCGNHWKNDSKTGMFFNAYGFDKNVRIEYGGNATPKVKMYDICEHCIKELLEFLKPIKTEQ